jgi:uncharacterized protein
MPMHQKYKSKLKGIGIVLFLCFVLMNVVAFFHAYKFTHFATNNLAKTKNPNKLSTVAKLKTLLLGVNNPRPINTQKPASYETIVLQSNKKIECWYWKQNTISDTPKGTVILFHGYSGQKSSMLDKAEQFAQLNYNVLLVDFMGSGGSEGNQTTVGFQEAADVKTAFDFIKHQGEKNIYLFGTSMGAVAVLKSIADYNIQPSGIIVECPFGSMYQTTCARFKAMHAPIFPMAGLLVFWGGVQNGFWGFGHKPTKYAKQVKCPTLLLYGQQDATVSRQEIDEIYSNLSGPKQLKIYAQAGHENYLLQYKQQWVADVLDFLNKNKITNN